MRLLECNIINESDSDTLEEQFQEFAYSTASFDLTNSDLLVSLLGEKSYWHQIFYKASF